MNSDNLKQFDLIAFNDFVELLANSKIAFSIINEKATIEWYNNLFADFFKNINLLNKRLFNLLSYSPLDIVRFNNNTIDNSLTYDDEVFSPIINKWFQLTATPIIIKPDKFKILIFLQDITYKKLNSDIFLQLNKLFEGFEDAIFCVDKNNKFIFWNKASEKLFGYSQSEILGKTLQRDIRLFKTLDSEIEYQIKSEITNYHNSYLETDSFRKDGSNFWALLGLSVLFDSDKEIEQIIHFVRNGSHSKNLEQIKNTYHSLNTLTQNHLPLSSDDFNINKVTDELIAKCMNLTDSNLCLMINFIKEDVKIVSISLSKDLIKLVENKKLLLKELLKKLKSQIEISNPDQLITSSNLSIESRNIIAQLQFSDVIAFPLLNSNKLSSGFIFIAKKKSSFNYLSIDILSHIRLLIEINTSFSEQLKLYHLLEEKLRESQKLETNYYIQSGLLHDFNNILTSSILLLELLKKDLNNKTLDEHVRNLKELFERAGSLIKSVIKQNPHSTPDKSVFNINKLVEELFDFLKKILPQKITISFISEENLADIYANYSQLHQVLLNICLNAKDSISSEGFIKISTFSSVVKNNSELKDGNYIVIAVEDNGCGIIPENLNKIFDPYFTTKQNSGGTGLGLFVTKNIITAHQGKITLKSKVNSGTRFEIFLPSYEPYTNADKSEIRPVSSILLVDDEKILSNLLAELLSMNGFQVIQSNNGLETIKILSSKNDFDLIILDYYLGDLTADDLLVKLTNLNPRTKIIVTSGITDKSIKDRLTLMGVLTIFNKPYDVENLILYIKNLT